MAENKKEPCWYVIHTYSGYENKVKDTLEKSVCGIPAALPALWDRIPSLFR